MMRAMLYGGRFDGLELEVKPSAMTVLVPLVGPLSVIGYSSENDSDLVNIETTAYLRSKQVFDGRVVFILKED